MAPSRRYHTIIMALTLIFFGEWLHPCLRQIAKARHLLNGKDQSRYKGST